MAELVIAEKSELTNIANAIRAKTETADTLALSEMPQMIMDIETGVDTSDGTATASDILSGKTAYVDGTKVTGNIATKTSSDLTASGATVSVPAGYYSSGISKSVATATQATPSISVDSAGKITASATQTAGYVAAGTKSATKQLTAQAAQTITPGTSNKTIASGRYLTGTQTIKGDANLVAGNIKSGVTIFNVAGSFEGEGLNLVVVGGTTQPTSPADNTIWVNTSTTINGYAFSKDAPTSPTSGMVWFETNIGGTASINVDKENTVMIYPIGCKQYISGAWVLKPVMTYQDGQWQDWIRFLYNYGETDLTFSFSPQQFANGFLGEDYIHLESTNKYSGTVNMSASPAIDLTPYTVAKIEIENTGGYATMTIYLGSAYWQYKGELSKTTVSIDISSLTGEHSLSASRITNSDSRAVGITKIWSIRLE